MPHHGPDFYRTLPDDPPALREELTAQAAAAERFVPAWSDPTAPEGPIPPEPARYPAPAPVVPLHAAAPAPAPEMAPDPSQGEEPRPRPRTVSAADLVVMDFPEPVWAVPGLLCEGVNLLVGAPKIGKSWLSLHLGAAVAAGAPALGKLHPAPGPVLYLALEDTHRRLKSRLVKVLDNQPAPPGLALATELPTLSQRGDVHIQTWLEDNPGARMVIIDVFAKFRGTPPAGLSAYEADYRAVSAVKRLADAHQVAVVLVHHTRKMTGEDFLQEVSGTNGLAGAADATLVLKRSRGTADGVLNVTGRDVEEAEHALSFDPHTGLWSLLDGPAVDHTVTDTRALILAHLREHGNATPKELAAALDIKPNTVKTALKRMSDAAPPQVLNDGNGLYSAPGGLSPWEGFQDTLDGAS